MTTQALVPVHVALSSSSLVNKTKTTLTVTLTDVGDAVAGAKVSVAGHTATTNSKGKATITFAKGAKTGTYTVSAGAFDYLGGSAKVTIKS